MNLMNNQISSSGLKKSNKSGLMMIYFFIEVNQTAL